MNIEATKLELMYLLLQTQKESLLKKVKSVFEEEQKEIKTGLTQVDKAEYIANKTVMKHFDRWH